MKQIHQELKKLTATVGISCSSWVTYVSNFMTSSEIPITQPPTLTSSWALEGLGLELGLQLRLGLPQSYTPARPNLMCQRARPVRSMTSPLTKLRVIIIYFQLPRHTYFYPISHALFYFQYILVSIFYSYIRQRFSLVTTSSLHRALCTSSL